MEQTFDRVLGSRFIIRWTYHKRGQWFYAYVTAYDVQKQRKSDISRLNFIISEFCEGDQTRYVKTHEDDIDMDIDLIGVLNEQDLFQALEEDIAEGEWANLMQEGDPMFRQIEKVL